MNTYATLDNFKPGERWLAVSEGWQSLQGPFHEVECIEWSPSGKYVKVRFLTVALFSGFQTFPTYSKGFPMKAKLIKPPSLREQLKTIASQDTSSSSTSSGLASATIAINKKQSSKPRTIKQSKPLSSKQRQKKSPQVTILIEQLAQGIELLEEIFK